MKISHSQLISDMAWAVIRAITAGERLEGAMHRIFIMVTNWVAENNKEKVNEVRSDG